MHYFTMYPEEVLDELDNIVDVGIFNVVRPKEVQHAVDRCRVSVHKSLKLFLVLVGKSRLWVLDIVRQIGK